LKRDLGEVKGLDCQELLQDKDWEAASGATQDALDALIAASDTDLPSDYIAFLADSNGGNGPLSVHPLWLMLYPAEMITDLLNDVPRRAMFPGLFIIGSNGAGESIAFDFRSGATVGVIHFDMINSDLQESVVPLAASFTQLLALLESPMASGAAQGAL
jgi:hypothetical protein